MLSKDVKNLKQKENNSHLPQINAVSALFHSLGASNTTGRVSLQIQIVLFFLSSPHGLLSGKESHAHGKRIIYQKWETAQRIQRLNCSHMCWALESSSAQEMGKSLFHSNFQSRWGVSGRLKAAMRMHGEAVLQRSGNVNFRSKER